MNDNHSELIKELIDKTRPVSEQLTDILQKIQQQHNYLPQNLLQELSALSNINMAHITDIATFYPSFRLRPAGIHTIHVCTGTACHVKGAESLFDAIKRYLNIADNDDTDASLTFTIEKAACLGCCTLAPAVQIDSVVYGNCRPETAGTLIEQFLARPTQEHKTTVPDGESNHSTIKMCLCTSCRASGALEIYTILEDRIRQKQLPVTLAETSCTGMASFTPIVEVIDANSESCCYGPVTVDSIEELFETHFTTNNIAHRIKNLAVLAVSGLAGIEQGSLPGQVNLDLENSTDIVLCSRGNHHPLDLAAYIGENGFSALKRVIMENDKNVVIAMIKESGIRGRGGAGFPSWKKWQAITESHGGKRYLICNGDEGDPGAFMDRLLMESFPFRVLEGMLIAARTLNIDTAYIYIRSEYPLAIGRMQQALSILNEKQNTVVESGLQCGITIISGAGAFVCGEETALIAAIEGNRGNPIYRPPYPAQSGLYGRPTLVHNVETLASLPWIINNGPQAFLKIGTTASHGTKTLALAGKIRHGGLVEVPLGTTLRKIIYEIGGGIEDDAEFKAVLIGGPSGGCLPAQLIDQPVAYESLVEYGAIMGSGGLVVLDEHDCMVDLARYFMLFTADQSCGKCTACRVGTAQMLKILEGLCQGTAGESDLDQLDDLAHTVKSSSLCGLGKTAPNPVLTTLRWFMDEYKAHINGKCPSLSCKSLIRYRVSDQCIGCTRCAQFCPVDAIESIPHQYHKIDDSICIRCGSCRRVCPTGAIEVIT